MIDRTLDELVEHYDGEYTIEGLDDVDTDESVDIDELDSDIDLIEDDGYEGAAYRHWLGSDQLDDEGYGYNG